MDVLGTSEFRRGLTPPFRLGTFLVEAGIDSDEVDEVEIDWLTVFIYSPRDVDAAAFIVIGVGISWVCLVWQIISIAIAEADEHVIIRTPATVDISRVVPDIIRQTSSLEGQAIGQP